MVRTHQPALGQQTALLAIPCPACGLAASMWLGGDLWECPACAYEWREER